MRPYIIAFAVALCASPVLAGEGIALPAMPNLARNPGFEAPGPEAGVAEHWRGSREVYSRDDSVKHSGDASLRFANADPKRYVLYSQTVPCEAGRRYEFSVWVKTEGIDGEDNGATICMEWSKQGKWAGGSYPKGIKGTSDWTLVKGLSRRIPSDVTGCTVTCYVRKGMTGAAWFDDVTVRRAADPILTTVLLCPPYRGRVVRGQTKHVRVRAGLNLFDYDLEPQQVALEADVLSGATSVRSCPRQPVPGPTATLSLSAAGLPATDLSVRVRLVRVTDGAILGVGTHALTHVAADLRPTVTIDPHRRALVNGEPFFPLGMYWSGINKADIETYADSAFNCLMPYGSPKPEQMDLAQEHGLKVIYSIKDFYFGTRYCPGVIKSEADEKREVLSRVRLHRDHPALLAWYLNDELPTSMMPRLNAHQRWVEQEDPNHPTWVVLYQVGDVSKYLDSFDVIGTDPYPIPRKPPSLAGAWTRMTMAQVCRARPVWMVPQVFNWANYRKTPEEREGLRPPTLEEMRSMAWQCICEGATGLVFYSYFDLKRGTSASFEERWSDCKSLAAEIKEMFPVLLSVEPVPALTVIAGDWLNWTARRHGGKVYVLTVNNGDGDGAVAIRAPGEFREARVLGESRSIPIRNGQFADQSEKLGVRHYVLE